jgi:hypothetical protein
VGVDGGVARSTRQVLSVSEGNVLALRVFVTLSESKVDNVDIIFGALIASNQEVVRFDVSVDDSLFVNFLNSVNLEEYKDNTKNH